MPIFKPENDDDFLKELESIENLCARALTSNLNDAGQMQALLKNVIRRAKNCQEYAKATLIWIGNT